MFRVPPQKYVDFSRNKIRSKSFFFNLNIQYNNQEFLENIGSNYREIIACNDIHIKKNKLIFVDKHNKEYICDTYISPNKNLKKIILTGIFIISVIIIFKLNR